MKEKPDLKIDWCTHEAAKFACKNWHYSKSMSVGKAVKIGVWENNIFIGVVLFGYGANPNLYKPYGLNQTECCELTRVALDKHITPVTQIIKRSLILLKEKNPLIRIVVSFADLNQGHIGGIYQGGNWIYTGMGKSTAQYLLNGKWIHQRQLGSLGYLSKNSTLPSRLGLDKYRYLMPLDKKMRRQIIKLSKPYPKKTCPEGVTGSTTGVQLVGIGSSPVSGLVNKTTVKIGEKTDA